MSNFAAILSSKIAKLKKLDSISFLFLILFSVFLVGCQWKNRLVTPDTSPSFRIARYDRLVDDFVRTKSFAAWQRMNTDFSLETQTLIERVACIGDADAVGIEDSLRGYYLRPELSSLRFDVAKKFGSLAPYEEILGRAFEHLKADVPDFVIPEVYAQVSGYRQSIVVGDSLIGLSLDKYLGADYPYYRRYYRVNERATMRAERLVSDCLIFYLSHQYPLGKDAMSASLLEHMLHQGKLYWIIAKEKGSTFIEESASTAEDAAWFEANERNVWRRITDDGLLARRDFDFVLSVIAPAHPTPYFRDRYSRGVGRWIGMRIVDGYMQAHPRVSVDSLLRLKDYQRLLSESGYAP